MEPLELADRTHAIAETGSMRGACPPSFAESQYEHVVRRQRKRVDNSLKVPYHQLEKVRSRTDPPPPSTEGGSIFAHHFAGWGSMSSMHLSSEEVDESERARRAARMKSGHGVLNAWLGTGVAGVAVAGSPFYAFPAVVAAAGIFSPIALLVATLLLSCWRPIMCELASAIPQSGANYVYMLNTSTKNVALLASCFTLLDDVATAVVSAGTAAAYLTDSVTISISQVWLAVVIIMAVGLLGLLGVREGAGTTCCILLFHVCVYSQLVCIAALQIAGIVQWARVGNGVLASNWHTGSSGSASEIAKSVFDGVCIAFLGVTGFETTPDYISSLRPRTYPAILRNLQYIAIFVNVPTILLAFANLPVTAITGNGTVLSSLAQVTAGSWLRILVTVDAILILCAGILTGIISACALLERLATDRVLPAFFRKSLPYSGAPYISLLFFVGLSLIVWAAANGNIIVVSGMFAIVFLTVMTVYPLVSFFLAASRPYLLRVPRNPLLLSFFTFALGLTLIVGNVLLAPLTLAYFIAYAGVLFLGLIMISRRSTVMHVAWWFSQRSRCTARSGSALVNAMEYLRGGPIVLFVKRDDIHRLFKMLLYCKNNEETARVKLVHFYRSPDMIPSELEANFKILDEAFPQITVDLVLVEGDFTPATAYATAERLNVPISMCFVGCPRDREEGLVEQLPVRIISSA